MLTAALVVVDAAVGISVFVLAFFFGSLVCFFPK